MTSPALATVVAYAEPIQPGQIRVIDGDTIRAALATYRLVGFDAPETYRAKCPSERELGNRATFFHSAGQRQTRSGWLCPARIVSRP